MPPSVPTRLILFDIDATLIRTSGAGIRAMAAGARDVHGPDFATGPIDYAGRLDPLIIADMLALNALAPTSERIGAIRDAYTRRLPGQIASDGVCTRLPGVGALLSALAQCDEVALGLMTGNYEATGRIKLSACGVDVSAFVIRVWGDQSPHEPPAREHLPPVAIERFRGTFGERIDPGRVTIIGDTPHDVACARANGCRALGVATGNFPVGDLSGADHVLKTLEQTGDVLAWLLDGR